MIVDVKDVIEVKDGVQLLINVGDISELQMEAVGTNDDISVVIVRYKNGEEKKVRVNKERGQKLFKHLKEKWEQFDQKFEQTLIENQILKKMATDNEKFVTDLQSQFQQLHHDAFTKIVSDNREMNHKINDQLQSAEKVLVGHMKSIDNKIDGKLNQLVDSLKTPVEDQIQSLSNSIKKLHQLIKNPIKI